MYTHLKKGGLVFLAALLVGGAVQAQQGGGYRGPGVTAITVAEAKKLRDDAPVVLRGNITRFLGDENYLFSDGSGNIVIEIDDTLWNGLSVDQNDTVEIAGEIDKDLKGVKVEVKRIRKL